MGLFTETLSYLIPPARCGFVVQPLRSFNSRRRYALLRISEAPASENFMTAYRLIVTTQVLCSHLAVDNRRCGMIHVVSKPAKEIKHY